MRVRDAREGAGLRRYDLASMGTHPCECVMADAGFLPLLTTAGFNGDAPLRVRDGV